MNTRITIPNPVLNSCPVSALFVIVILEIQ